MNLRLRLIYILFLCVCPFTSLPLISTKYMLTFIPLKVFEMMFFFLMQMSKSKPKKAEKPEVNASAKRVEWVVLDCWGMGGDDMCEFNLKF
jgi:hypothetical protein